jgi:hypothetical protein
MIKFLEPTEQSAPQAPSLDKVDDLPVDRYLLNVNKLIKDEAESPEAKVRAQTIVQMCRRYRGATPSDLFGYWRNGNWADSPRFASLHGTNVFQALVHAAEAGFMQARISLDVSAKVNSFQNRAIEKIARSIYEVLDKTDWAEQERSIFFASILKLNAFVISRFNKAGGPELPVPQFSPTAYQHGGMWVCPNCYASGEYREGAETCPQCGGQTSMLQDPEQVQDYLVSGYGKQPVGMVETVVADALTLTLDDRKGKAVSVEECEWAQWRYLAAKSELKKLYPHLKLEKKPEWSYPTRLLMALKRYESGEAMPKSEFERQQYEVQQDWYDRTIYEGYVSPTDFQLGNFQIRAGQRLADVLPEGAVVGYVNGEVAFVDGEDKNYSIKTMTWLEDPTSIYGLGARAGLPLQKKINQLDNMAMEGEARSLKGAVVYDPQAVDGANLEGANTNIPLRPDFTSGGNPLKNFVMPLNVSGLSVASMSFLASQVDTMQRVMGIPDVSLGEGDPYVQTASGQSLVAQRASGLLIPAKIAEGNMKIGWLKDQLRLMQKYYSPEALLKFGSRYGKEWLDDEVAAFFEAPDVCEALAIEIVEGSEIPESRQEKQQKLRADIANGFIPLTPQLQTKLAQQAGYDGIDVNFYESNEKLAEKRLNWVKDTVNNPQLEQQYQMIEMQLTDPKTGMRMTDISGNPVPNPLVQQLLLGPVLKVNRQAENHQQQFEFWQERTRQFLSAGQQQPGILIAVCDAMMTQHKGMAFQQMAEAQTLMGLAQAPMQIGGQVIANQLAPPEPKEKSSKK